MKTYNRKMLIAISFVLFSLTCSYTFALNSTNAPSLTISEDSQNFFQVEVGIPYTLGDNHTKLLARNIAMKENNIKVSKLAGSNIHASEGKVNDQFTQEKIAQLASALMISSIVNERYFVAGQNMGVFLTVNISIDKKNLLAKLNKLNEDTVLKQKFNLAVEENNLLLSELKQIDTKLQLTGHSPAEALITARQKLLNDIYTNSASYEDDANKQLAIENAEKVIQEQTNSDVINIESMKYTLSKIVPKLIANEAIYTTNKSDNTVNIEINVAFEPSQEVIPEKFKGEEDAYGLKNLLLKGFEVSSQPTIKLTAQDIDKGLKGTESQQTVYIVKKRKSKISPRSKALVENLNKLQVNIEVMMGEYSGTVNLTKHNIDNLSFQFKGSEQVKLKNIPKEIANSTPLTTRVIFYYQQ
tara:strand:+ start:10039 stop:11277 length:1239 start_codon:yes stop_codon:yes gene_type:complete